METVTEDTLISLETLARDLPIRDGNENGGIKRHPKKGGPRPSYKGWKLAVITPARSNRGSPRPSYKGWKQPLFARRSAFEESPRPSYKGWKR